MQHTENMLATVRVIISSTCAVRVGPTIAAWVMDVAQAAHSQASYKLLDLADWHLPMDDEPEIPAGGGKSAAQLRQVTQGLKMRAVPTMPGITLTEEMIHGGPITPENDFADAVEPIRKATAELRDALMGL
jgi:NAD(P)H-dependent FMN reductase